MRIASLLTDHGRYVNSVLSQLIEALPTLDNAARLERSAIAFGKISSFIDEQRTFVRNLVDLDKYDTRMQEYEQLADTLEEDLKTATMFHVDDIGYPDHLRHIEHEFAMFLNPRFSATVDVLEKQLSDEQIGSMLCSIENARDDALARHGATFSSVDPEPKFL